MKKVSALLVFVIFLTCWTSASYAETTSKYNVPGQSATNVEIINVAPVSTVTDATSNHLRVDLDLVKRMMVIDSVAKLQLYNENGVLLSEKEEWVGGITEKLSFDFEIPEYTPGALFYLRLASGLDFLKYYDTVYHIGEDIPLTTYAFYNESGELIIGNSFAMESSPLYEHALIVYVEGNQLNLEPRARLIDNTAMGPVKEIAEAMGLNVRFDERYNSVVCSIASKEAIFNIDTAYATILGNDTYLPVACQRIDGSVFVPVRALADAFQAEISAPDFGDHIDICIGESQVVREYIKDSPVNDWDIASRTNWMVWVDKSNFRVHVYTGRKNKWVEEKSFPCAIGAPDSPTITGSFEYEYKMDRWDYPGYYVGPCLVFYGNYAIHSVLLYNNGTPYDNRTGVMISHGCVRVHKPDIDWLAANLPRGSRVYITN